VSSDRPLLFNLCGDAKIRPGGLEIEGVEGEVGMEVPIRVLLPTDETIPSMTINGREVDFDQAGRVVTSTVQFAGEAFAHNQAVTRYDPTFSGTRIEGEFVIPQRVFDQLAERRPDEAQDSYDVLDAWLETAAAPDERPRVFFCHLGPPYANDALAIRQGPLKLIVDGGLAMPWSNGSGRGAAVPVAFYDLGKNLYEAGNKQISDPGEAAQGLAATLRTIHNRGYARDLQLPSGQAMILDDGWHNLRNDVTGEVGLEFQLRPGCREKWVTHLGMWDDHEGDRPVRPARALPTEHQRDQPARPDPPGKRRRLQTPHTLRLLRVDGDVPTEIARGVISPDHPGALHGAFRYLPLDEAVCLHQGEAYAVLMSTEAGDGDLFHDPSSFDGLSPLVHPDIVVVRSILLRNRGSGRRAALPAFEDLSESYSRHRLPVGPTVRFRP
jgi:hypothetical protein